MTRQRAAYVDLTSMAPDEAQAELRRRMSEKDFQARVVALAKAKGWIVYHTRDARKSEPGFPDLTLAKKGRLIFAELKREGQQPTEAQYKWLGTLGSIPGVLADWWTPADWETIEILLADPPAGSSLVQGAGE